MNVEKTDFKGANGTIVVSGTDHQFMNSVRRVLKEDIPKMAIEYVEFHLGSITDENGKSYESTTPLFDEIIAHRLGLIPIPSVPGQYVKRDECECNGDGCSQCTIMYSLSKKGPGTVYSGDMEPLGDISLKPKDDLIPIVKLTKDEAILIYCSAILGTGKEHAKWQVTNAMAYQEYPIIDIDQSKINDAERCVKACPRGALEVKKGVLKVKDLEACNLCNSCAEECDGISVKASQDKFIMRLETDGSMDAETAFGEALNILETRFDNFREAVASFG